MFDSIPDFIHSIGSWINRLLLGIFGSRNERLLDEMTPLVEAIAALEPEYEDLSDAELKDRQILAEEGFVSVFAVVDSTTGKVASGPTIHARGVAEDDSVFDAILPKIQSALEEATAGGSVDAQQLQQVMRRTLGHWVGTKLRRRPMIIPVVVEA